MLLKIQDFRGEFDKLKEDLLIIKAFKFILVSTLVSILAMFSPWIYAIIPASDSSICLCHFLKDSKLSGFEKVTHIQY
jgi:hypothetical protein